MLPRQTRVAVLFRRLGAYHHARLNAAGKLMDLSGVEACGMDKTYAWEKVEGARAFKRITLTDQQINSRDWAQRVCRQMQHVLHETKPQAVVVPGWSSTDGLSALSWCLQTHTPAVMMSESTELDERRVAWKEWIKRRLLGLCSSALVGGTPHVEYLEKLGMPRKCIFPGYDAVDNGYFAENAKEVRSQKSEARRKHGLPEDYFLASARFVEKKNLPRLVEAYARYRKLASGPSTLNSQPTITPWSLVILGDGPLRDTLNSQLSTLGLHGHVQMPGFKQYNELPACYGLAKAFIHASTTEQWGLVVNEAMASGLPVLVSNRCGCAQDLVREGINGFTFDPCDVEQLARLMLKLSTLNAHLPTFGSASQEIISHWGPERFAAGLSRAIEIAVRRPFPRTSLLDRALIKLLLRRQAAAE